MLPTLEVSAEDFRTGKVPKGTLTAVQKALREANAGKLRSKFSVLWKMLRGPRLKEEVLFHPDRQWRLDFAYESFAIKVAIELEGGIWTGYGRGSKKKKGQDGHSHPMNIERDIEKQNAAVLLGWRYFRFSDKRITGPDIQPLIALIERSEANTLLLLRQFGAEAPKPGEPIKSEELMKLPTGLAGELIGTNFGRKRE
jgi:very-short-patch-repair endonuclease